MPYFRETTTDELTLPSNPAYRVQMKRRATYGDRLEGQAAMVKVATETNDYTGETEVALKDFEIAAFQRTITARLIVSWNLDDEAGNPVPVTPEAIEALDPEDGEFLAREATLRAGLRREEEQRPLSSKSSKPAEPKRGKGSVSLRSI